MPGTKRKSRLKTPALAAAVLLCVLAGVLISMMLTANLPEVRDMPISFAADEISGINAGRDAIYLGRAPRGSSSMRQIHITSDEERQVTVAAIGNISEVLAVSENSFRVFPGEKKTLTLTATAPADAKYVTEYNGTLRLFFWRV